MSLKRTTLGRTGLQVTCLGFGAIPITRLAPDDAVALVGQALDAGINFIDTAYSYPDSEPRIGRAIAGRDRSQLVISTKDGSRDGPTFTAHVEESLRRLCTDYVDIVQLHNVATAENWDAVRAPGGAIEAAMKLKDAGKVRHLGVTSHSVDLSYEMVRSGLFETLQLPLNFVADEGAAVAELCDELGVGFICMKPLAGGAIDDGKLALRYLQQFANVVPIPGIETRDELDELLRVAAEPRELQDAERSRIEALRQEIGKVFCRACGYCMPCPQEMPIQMILRFQSIAKRMPAESAYRAGRRHMPKVDDCTGCRACVQRCPYDLEIPAMLHDARDWFNQWAADMGEPIS